MTSGDIGVGVIRAREIGATRDVIRNVQVLDVGHGGEIGGETGVVGQCLVPISVGGGMNASHLIGDGTIEMNREFFERSEFAARRSGGRYDVCVGC